MAVVKLNNINNHLDAIAVIGIIIYNKSRVIRRRKNQTSMWHIVQLTTDNARRTTVNRSKTFKSDTTGGNVEKINKFGTLNFTQQAFQHETERFLKSTEPLENT
jgi:hypothetical protein